MVFDYPRKIGALHGNRSLAASILAAMSVESSYPVPEIIHAAETVYEIRRTAGCTRGKENVKARSYLKGNRRMRPYNRT